MRLRTFNERGDNVESYMDVTYKVIDPFTDESFFTTDRYVATHHYERGYTVHENHTTITISTPFNETHVRVISCWTDEDTEPEIKET